ncbi:MAG TPA: hypothetical protein VMF06_09665 [Candidatus Limnocylindria bacterium]|jgi:hypothetical protein|nr:hypothetical protein [Candidatus Limnocylindria bacterium]
MKKLLPLFWLVTAMLKAAVPPVEQCLPADTLFVASIPDASQGAVVWQQSNWGRLWVDPAMLAFRTNFEAKLVAAYDEHVGKETGIALADLRTLANGQLTLAMIADGWSGKTGDERAPAFVLILDSGTQGEALKAKLAEAKKKIGDSGHPLKAVQIGGIEFSQVVFSSEGKSPAAKAIAKPAPKSAAEKKADDDEEDDEPHVVEFAFGQVDSALLAGTSPAVLAKMIDNLRGTNAAPLANHPQYQMARTNALAGAAATVYLNVSSLSSNALPAVSSAFAMLSMLGADPNKVPGALGLQSVDYATIGIRGDTNGTLIRLEVSAPEARRKGLARLLETKPLDGGVPSMVPGDAVEFQRWRVNGSNVWATIDGAMNQISPQLGGLFKLTIESAAQSIEPNFNLTRDLASNLGDDFVEYVKPPRGKMLDELSNPPSVYWIGSGKPEALLVGLKGLAALKYMQAGNLGFASRESAGHKVHLITLKGPKGGNADTVLVEMAAMTNGVAMSGDPIALDELIQNTATNRLADLPETKNGVEAVGGMNQGVFAFINSRAKMSTTWESLRTAESIDKLMTSGTANLATVKAVQQWADFKTLPPFDQVSKYWTTMVMGGGSNTNGYDFRWMTPAAK